MNTAVDPINESDWKSYRKWAQGLWVANKSVMIDREMDMIIAAFGVIGESAEYQDAAQLYESNAIEVHKQNLLKEMGDVLYYLAILDYIFELDLNLRKIKIPENALNSLSLQERQHGLTTATGALSEHLKKYLRGDKNKIEDLFCAIEGKPSTIQSVLANIGLAVGVLGAYFGLTIGEALDANRTKLNSRKERNTLQGDGDHR